MLVLTMVPLAIASNGLSALLTALPLGAWWSALAVLVLLLSASQLAVAIVNWLVPMLMPPRVLPRMDYSFGIPSASRTLVVVPSMVSSAAAIDELVEALEVRFLANQDTHLHFALLTDFPDAAEQTLPSDEALVALARERIEDLNRRYAEPAGDTHHGDRFFLFHRPRRWNASEHVWMGHERKRGKLADLNALLRGGGHDRFSVIVGNTAALPGVRYVITLDTDTQLPRDAARKFVATMAHPLNRPRIGGRPESPRVVAGHGILQPRVGVSLAAASRTRFGRLFGGDAGIDPYTRATSDVYQDLFGEGSFIGKGIYDVDAFEHVLGGRLPENRVLSHDLLEGAYARSALISDVELVEESPSRYDADVKRRHRWIRGDWQIAAWLMPRVPTTVSEPGSDMPRLGARGQSAVAAVAPEDPGQPAAQPRSGVAHDAAAARLVGAGAARAVDAGGAGGLVRSGAAGPRGRPSAQARSPGLACATERRRGGSAASVHARGDLACDAALRGVVQHRCRRAHAVAPGCLAPGPARVAAVCRRGASAAHQRRRRLRRNGPAHGVRAGARSRLGCAARFLAARSTARCVAGAAAVGRIARHRLVAQPAARTAPVDHQRGAGALPAPAEPPHVAVLRDIRRPAGQPPATRQRAGAAGGAHRPPHLAHQHRPVSAGDVDGSRLRLRDDR